MKSLMISGALVVCLAVSACSPGPKSSRGFRLPDGDAAKGKQAFLDLKCNTCHQVAGVDLPAPTAFNLTLGGESTNVKTYGELVTSVIYPSHVISEQYQAQLTEARLSPMPDFNRTMTVEQMIDLVAFLQPCYKVALPEYMPSYYHP